MSAIQTVIINIPLDSLEITKIIAGMISTQKFRYTPFYCEENIWHLAQDPCFGGQDALVALISGEGSHRRLWHQSQAESPDSPVFWDYHVILLIRDRHWWVWDLDTTLGLPILADRYFPETFLGPGVDAENSDVTLRLIEADYYVQNFSSDRSHMRDANREWLAPPPGWPAIMKASKSNLIDWLDISRDGPGRVRFLAECIKNAGRDSPAFYG